jgi:predicted PurR-regulated permease PerM
MVKNIVIVALVFICLVLSVFSFIQAGIAEVHLKETVKNMNEAVRCSQETQKMKQQLELHEKELADRNKQLAAALEQAQAARARLIKERE